MDLIFAVASPFLVSNSSIIRKNIVFNRNTIENVACEEQVYSSLQYEVTNITDVSSVIRRSASYPPSLWPYERIQAINSKYTVCDLIFCHVINFVHSFFFIEN